MGTFALLRGIVDAARVPVIAAAAITPLRAKAESLAGGDFSPLWSGQSSSACREVGAAQLTCELAGKL